MNKKGPTLLVILDGWGFSTDSDHNAIFHAHPATFHFLWEHYPHALLRASGSAVGLPEGIPGNSEVGHMTIGAGCIIEQAVTRINNAIHHATFFKNQQIIDVLQTCKEKNGRLHLLGLLSNGCVHSNDDHLFALMKAAHDIGIPHTYIHAFLDGRDVGPKTAVHYIQKLEKNMQRYGGMLGSISGRWYAMDRDENWERTIATYQMLIGKGDIFSSSWFDLLQKSYTEDITDEFIEPILLNERAKIQDNDTLIFFNIRPDRMRQLVSLFLDVQFPSKKSKTQPNIIPPQHLVIATMVTYHKLFNVPVFFEEPAATQGLLDHFEQKSVSIFTIAETEKYAHVTYFFSGGNEVIRSNETRVLIPSQMEISYDKLPKMSAAEITKTVITSLETKPCDFYLINYANADMVGHSGNFEATVQAVTCVDEQLKSLYAIVIEKLDGILYITADHGKAENMWDIENNYPKTAHTTNPVPFIMVQKKLKDTHESLPLEQLSDIAPFILDIFFRP